jgi:predicted transcriptional regulator
MIEVKQAVRIATDYLTDLIPNIRDVQLEEVEFVDILPPQWNITLSYLRPVDPESLSAIAELTGHKYERVYKEIAVDAVSGACVSIKIRELQ